MSNSELNRSGSTLYELNIFKFCNNAFKLYNIYQFSNFLQLFERTDYHNIFALWFLYAFNVKYYEKVNNNNNHIECLSNLKNN